MEPSKKAPVMERFLEETFDRTTAIHGDTCVACKQPATSFKNELSRAHGVPGVHAEHPRNGGDTQMTEFHPTAVGVFLSSVHASMDSTGKRPMLNIISKALFKRIVDETGPTRAVDEPLPIGPCNGHGQICGYPVRVIESDHLFAVSIAIHYETKTTDSPKHC